MVVPCRADHPGRLTRALAAAGLLITACGPRSSPTVSPTLPNGGPSVVERAGTQPVFDVGDDVPPSAPAPAPDPAPASGAPPSDPAPLDLPPAPPPTEVAGAAAIVWVPDPNAADRVQSVWIEPRDGRAFERAFRQGMVFAGRDQLWEYAHHMVKPRVARCEDAVGCDDQEPLDAPYLRSLATGTKRPSPWAYEVGDTTSCNKTFGVVVEGMVGTVVFARTYSTSMECGAGCPMHWGTVELFDIDGARVETTLPDDIADPVRARVRDELGPDLTERCGTALLRASAEYDARGELVGVYEFGSAPTGICATSFTCPNPVERVPWVPAALRPWGKLPAWVAEYMAAKASTSAVVVEAARVPALYAQFER